MSDLPFIDEHAREIDAPPARTWEGLIAPRGLIRIPGGVARVFGFDPAARSGEPGTVGSTMIGFRVTKSVPERELTAEGRHSFSRYSVTFLIEEAGAGRSLLRARTYADFPGWHGTIYRAIEIRNQSHVDGTKAWLRIVAKRAERAT